MLNFDIRTQLIYVRRRDTDVNYSNKTRQTKGSRNRKAAREMFNRINDHYFNFYCINWATRVIINYSYCVPFKRILSMKFLLLCFLNGPFFCLPRNVFLCVTLIDTTTEKERSKVGKWRIWGRISREHVIVPQYLQILVNRSVKVKRVPTEN